MKMSFSWQLKLMCIKTHNLIDIFLFVWITGYVFYIIQWHLTGFVCVFFVLIYMNSKYQFSNMKYSLIFYYMDRTKYCVIS